MIIQNVLWLPKRRVRATAVADVDARRGAVGTTVTEELWQGRRRRMAVSFRTTPTSTTVLDAHAEEAAHVRRVYRVNKGLELVEEPRPANQSGCGISTGQAAFRVRASRLFDA